MVCHFADLYQHTLAEMHFLAWCVPYQEVPKAVASPHPEVTKAVVSPHREVTKAIASPAWK